MFWNFVNRRKLAFIQQTSQQLQISALSERTGAAAIAFFSHSNLEDTFEPNCYCPFADRLEILTAFPEKCWSMGWNGE